MWCLQEHLFRFLNVVLNHKPTERFWHDQQHCQWKTNCRHSTCTKHEAPTEVCCQSWEAKANYAAKENATVDENSWEWNKWAITTWRGQVHLCRKKLSLVQNQHQVLCLAWGHWLELLLERIGLPQPWSIFSQQHQQSSLKPLPLKVTQCSRIQPAPPPALLWFPILWTVCHHCSHWYLNCNQDTWPPNHLLAVSTLDISAIIKESHTEFGGKSGLLTITQKNGVQRCQDGAYQHILVEIPPLPFAGFAVLRECVCRQQFSTFPQALPSVPPPQSLSDTPHFTLQHSAALHSHDARVLLPVILLSPSW